jgi:hypothetical protein
MKRFIPAGMALFFTFQIISCNKDSVTANNSITLIKKWNLVSDEEYMGVGSVNHLVTYTGHAGDYFDFRGDSNVYIREGVLLDTLKYSLISDTLMSIASFGLGLPCRITNLSPDHAIISSPVILTPGGAFGRKVILNW